MLLISYLQTNKQINDKFIYKNLIKNINKEKKFN